MTHKYTVFKSVDAILILLKIRMTSLNNDHVIVCDRLSISNVQKFGTIEFDTIVVISVKLKRVK